MVFGDTHDDVAMGCVVDVCAAFGKGIVCYSLHGQCKLDKTVESLNKSARLRAAK